MAKPPKNFRMRSRRSWGGVKFPKLYGVLLMVAVVALTGSRCGELSAADDIARNLINASRGTAGALDQSAVAGDIERTLKPWLSRVDDEDQLALLDNACDLKNLYDSGQISGDQEAVEWLQTQGKSAYARKSAVLQLQAKLRQLNRDPTYSGLLTVTGDSICTARQMSNR